DPFPSPLFDPYRGQIRFVIVDFLIPAVRLFVVAGTGSAAVVVVAAAVAAVVAAADLAWIADSADCSVCSSAEATAKARAVAAVASCSLAPRFSSSHNRSCPSLLYFAARV